MVSDAGLWLGKFNCSSNRVPFFVYEHSHLSAHRSLRSDFWNGSPRFPMIWPKPSWMGDHHMLWTLWRSTRSRFVDGSVACILRGGWDIPGAWKSRDYHTGEKYYIYIYIYVCVCLRMCIGHGKPFETPNQSVNLKFNWLMAKGIVFV